MQACLSLAFCIRDNLHKSRELAYILIRVKELKFPTFGCLPQKPGLKKQSDQGLPCLLF